jgi:hypothetical protein
MPENAERAVPSEALLAEARALEDAAEKLIAERDAISERLSAVRRRQFCICGILGERELSANARNQGLAPQGETDAK